MRAVAAEPLTVLLEGLSTVDGFCPWICQRRGVEVAPMLPRMTGAAAGDNGDRQATRGHAVRLLNRRLTVGPVGGAAYGPGISGPMESLLIK